MTSNQIMLEVDLEIQALVQKKREQYPDYDITVPYRVRVERPDAATVKHAGNTHKLAIKLVAEPKHRKEQTA